ncbi:DUF6344 domain-containing protein [Streptomyces sp. NBC_00243]|uniref:DUF6344 domain-containing protein n=1 Tax=Streptomyces sp. NBC_00243 TaxID=2975688 RepID=UPI002DD859B6|nr:DUF6344 domain-containing protein [Streptomyces sp. NBC_00243]WRZ21229.1 DUF6344 domain-containing protein [Streptomyces sp. NBC_00243]
MARNQVMKLWTAIVTLLLSLFTAAGFVTTTAAAAVPQSVPVRNAGTPAVMVPAAPVWSGAHDRGLPPTMKQRIRAEAHGSSPSCRHRPPLDATAAETTDLTDSSVTAGSTTETGSTSTVDCPAGTR